MNPKSAVEAIALSSRKDQKESDSGGEDETPTNRMCIHVQFKERAIAKYFISSYISAFVHTQRLQSLKNTPKLMALHWRVKNARQRTIELLVDEFLWSKNQQKCWTDAKSRIFV